MEGNFSEVALIDEEATTLSGLHTEERQGFRDSARRNDNASGTPVHAHDMGVRIYTLTCERPPLAPSIDPSIREQEKPSPRTIFRLFEMGIEKKRQNCALTPKRIVIMTLYFRMHVELRSAG
mmetsp:Transcript_23067/g.57330  ORF Transcript_23067/g.57330 Transcript_23067/m.57330 type:complete len:122 (-) Transcript_23067:2310-2675(-)